MQLLQLSSFLQTSGQFTAESLVSFSRKVVVSISRISTFSFVQLDNIELHKIDSEQYDKPDIYRPAFAKTIWKPKFHDKLLREIANDNTRAFFVSFDKNVIIAPYDGGVDFLLKDITTKENYKNKYKHWLSERKDGL